ncbi:MAG: thiamine pyrophosphate-binding protein [Deltaproteobacteria bacterium]|nr:thiamine pyrophosphate-binding protein [Deltaproteobacteria bacterium]MBN2671802.1 thiamine pyrophosphate-binding protein [Deltaproteobacteria bacterium]
MDSERKFLMGNEAVALGACHAGVSLGVGYPGTPSSEILAYLNHFGGKAQWSPNEKVAAEVGLGVAFGNGRAMVTMKHVGLNVAADALFTAAYSGVDGAYVLAVADDPGLASSQNEQDTRRYAVAAGVPLLDPSDSQDAYDFTRLAFDISARWHIPVILRLTTRVCHSGSVVVPDVPVQNLPAPHFTRNIKQRVMVPGHARPAHRRLRQKLKEIERWNNDEGPNREVLGDGRLGIIASGVAAQHAAEAAPDASLFKVGMAYPLPVERIIEFCAKHEKNAAIEENDPYMNELLKSYGAPLTVMPEYMRFGELNVARIRRLLDGAPEPEHAVPPGKPPGLCKGCPHKRTFELLKKHGCIVSGDIGCYTLAALPPLEAMDMQICMGASIGMGVGLRQVLPAAEARKVVSVIGDSTFVHSGLTGLAEMAYNVPPTGHVVLILDNSTTAMTGQQEHPGTGRRLDGSPTGQLDYARVATAMGIDNVVTYDPVKDAEPFEAALVDALRKDSLSVFVVKRPCILAAARKGAKG